MKRNLVNTLVVVILTLYATVFVGIVAWNYIHYVWNK